VDLTDAASVKVVVGGRGTVSDPTAVLGQGRDPRYQGLGARVIVRKGTGGVGGGREVDSLSYMALRLLAGVPEGPDLVDRWVEGSEGVAWDHHA
jgi:hypothetical protein